MALAGLGKAPDEVAIFSGIGCSGKVPHFVNAYGVHTLHGRVLPFATGAKLANPKLEIIAVGGDGDGMGIGAAHFVHAGRRNVDFTYVIHDNHVYGLTKGQASPTMPRGVKTKALPNPNIQGEVNPLWLALASGATFVARAYSFDVKHLVSILTRAVQHKGYAFVDVLQPCPTYDNVSTKDWYGGADRKDPTTGKTLPRIYRVETKNGFDPVVSKHDEAAKKIAQALDLALQWGDRIPIGVFYQNEQVPTFEERLDERLSGYLDHVPSAQVLADASGASVADLTEAFEELRV
jgi:2-oxoglutarate ferredoxin oxidoreductase subunit beta